MKKARQAADAVVFFMSDALNPPAPLDTPTVRIVEGLQWMAVTVTWGGDDPQHSTLLIKAVSGEDGPTLQIQHSELSPEAATEGLIPTPPDGGGGRNRKLPEGWNVTTVIDRPDT